MSDFFEQYKHPNWQRVSAEVRARARYRCESCDATDKQLQAHHTYYEKDCAPWEYPIESIRCLCEDCHKRYQAFYNEFKRWLGRIPISDYEDLIGYMKALKASDDILFDREATVRLDSAEEIAGFARYFGFEYFIFADIVCRDDDFTLPVSLIEKLEKKRRHDYPKWWHSREFIGGEGI